MPARQHEPRRLCGCRVPLMDHKARPEHGALPQPRPHELANEEGVKVRRARHLVVPPKLPQRPRVHQEEVSRCREERLLLLLLPIQSFWVLRCRPFRPPRELLAHTPVAVAEALLLAHRAGLLRGEQAEELTKHLPPVLQRGEWVQEAGDLSAVHAVEGKRVEARGCDGSEGVHAQYHVAVCEEYPLAAGAAGSDVLGHELEEALASAVGYRIVELGAHGDDPGGDGAAWGTAEKGCEGGGGGERVPLHDDDLYRGRDLLSIAEKKVETVLQAPSVVSPQVVVPPAHDDGEVWVLHVPLWWDGRSMRWGEGGLSSRGFGPRFWG
mmetsp:Transcript_30233/g.74076  ORF Transcript_30233/g.74076 Transcript_30233/m.74076 type:complete len:324 (-) Transcript_30233:104-1075(-)